MKRFPTTLQDKLQQRKAANALRQLPVQGSLIDFSSNDYLGYASSAVLFDATHTYLNEKNIKKNGATGSRLISGNHNLYTEAEHLLADFHQSESALIFNSGYDANIGFFSSVPQKGDVMIYDEYIHASIRDGIRLGNAKAYKYRHNDLEHLQKLITAHKNDNGEVYIVTESVFSMDGDSPDLKALVELSKKYNCNLVIDEAHALGVFGNRGQGLVQSLNLHEKVFARIMTFGKGLGCHGAAVLGSVQLREYLVNFVRSFIYTTGLPPHSLAAILTAYRLLEKDADTREALQANIAFFKAEAKKLNIATHFILSNSAIHCVVIPGNESVKQVSATMQEQDFSVKAILSPTVPAGQERLRFCLHSYTTKEQIKSVLRLLMPLLPQ